MLPLTLALLVLAADPAPRDVPKDVPATRDEVKRALEEHKHARPRLPLPPAADGDGPFARVNNGRFRSYYLPAAVREAGFTRDPDPAMTLDPTFKVKLFWVTSRTNNCYYCLGHQEHKLAAAGVSDDAIAALDGDWSSFAPAERAALAFTRKLTFEPHRVGPADVEALRKFYTPVQVAELVLTVAGYNATNRWTDGLNIPAEESGAFFKKPGTAVNLDTFRTPTSPAFASQVSRVAPLAAAVRSAGPPCVPARPPLESRARVEEAWRDARTRTPVLPLATEEAARAAWSEGPVPQWVRLLALFPKAGRARIAMLQPGGDKGTLSPRLRAELAWVAARQDRAWYALAVARERLKALGLTDDEVFALDDDPARQPEPERLALAFGRKLAAAPATVTDQDVERLRKHYKDGQVAEIVHNICNAAFFDRVTEAAQLPVEP